jgi:N-methylhydantoinase A/oxoprolinase/acetone carboxylase beta subunit
MQVAALRIGLPASASLPPFIDWPEDLAEYVNGGVFMVEGGHEYDGRELMPLDTAGIEAAAQEIAARGIRSVAISSIFSPLNPTCENQAAEILEQVCPGIAITKSHELGRIGLLERENVALLNACLQDLATKTTSAFIQALAESGIQAPLYLTQNDGTVMLAEVAERFPVYSFASGPTNSMRGAAFLSGLQDAMVVDVGGTTTDIGFLVNGFPRQANNVVQIGGVRTLFRMPDLLSVGLGGGTCVRTAPLGVGPDSVGYRLTEEALVFGGDTLTASDIAVAAGTASFGDADRVDGLDPAVIAEAVATMKAMMEDATDRMKTDANPVPLVAVGGGAFLIPDGMEGVTEVLRVPNNAVANAVGAAIAQVSAEVDQIFNGLGRAQAMAEAQRIATEHAVAAGAARETIELVSIEDLPIAYLPGDSLRVHARVVGDVAGS